MTRRTVLSTAAAAPFLQAGSQGSSTKPSIITIGVLKLRNGADNQRQRAVEFLKAFVPAIRRAGAGPTGAFSSNVGEGTPYLMMISSYPGLAEMEAADAKLDQDAEFGKAVATWYAGGQPYVRFESSLLRSFKTIPVMQLPPTEGRTKNRIYELRTYESQNFATLNRKIQMFDSGEIGIFRRLGFPPVFCAETVFGRNMPNLTYMVGHDDFAAREKNWSAFGGDAEWKKMSTAPEYSDPALVTNITVSILNPLPFSEIR